MHNCVKNCRPISLLSFVSKVLYIHESYLLKFVDDAKCFIHVRTLSDHKALQDNITALLTWSRDVDLDFSLKKFIHYHSNLNSTPFTLCPIQLYVTKLT